MSAQGFSPSHNYTGEEEDHQQQTTPRTRTAKSTKPRRGSGKPSSSRRATSSRPSYQPPRVEEDSDGSDGDDDWMCRDEEYDSEDLSLGTAKKSRWLRDFFQWLDTLSDQQVDDPTIWIHCPACKDGPGAINWYNGFAKVMNHAASVISKRMRLHRRLAEILNGELRRRRDKGFEQRFVGWKGLEEDVGDHLIVWPPMVIVQNTRSFKDGNGQWVGVEKTKLLSCFKQHGIKKVKNVYGRDGHCGVSLLIFDSSAVGYIEAESMHKQFIREGRGKGEWETHREHMQPAGERLLYGYIAMEGDMELLNKNSRGKQKYKFEMKSYKMMVLSPLKDSGDRLNIVGQKLRLREIEIKTIRKKAVEEIEESRKAIDFLDQHYVDTIKQMSDEFEKVIVECEDMQKSFLVLPNLESPSVALGSS